MSSTEQNQSNPIASETSANGNAKGREKPSGMLANIAFNIIIPTLILTKLSSEDYLGPVYSIVVALAFPIVYGIRDYTRSHKPNFFSMLGVFSVGLSSGCWSKACAS